jgi:hypothetical protein
MIMTDFGGIAELERDRIRERTGAGRDAAKKRGVQFGPPRKLNPERMQLVRRLLEEGKSMRDRAKTFDVHIATIYRLSAAVPKAGFLFRCSQKPQEPMVLPLFEAAVREAKIPFGYPDVTYYRGRENFVASSKWQVGAISESILALLQKLLSLPTGSSVCPIVRLWR